ncbi:hypothetical protein DsansV1_C13g0122711 [Dioscorea sansibarensis]
MCVGFSVGSAVGEEARWRRRRRLLHCGFSRRRRGMKHRGGDSAGNEGREY